jgi:hypothetical protein
MTRASYCPPTTRAVVVKLWMNSPWVKVAVVELVVRIILNGFPGV